MNLLNFTADQWCYYVFVGAKLGETPSKYPYVTIAVLSQEVSVSGGQCSHISSHSPRSAKDLCKVCAPPPDRWTEERRRCSLFPIFPHRICGKQQEASVRHHHWWQEKVFYFQVPHKNQNKAWVARKDPRPTVLFASYPSHKQMFCGFCDF